MSAGWQRKDMVGSAEEGLGHPVERLVNASLAQLIAAARLPRGSICPVAMNAALRGVRVLTATRDDLTDTSDPSRVMMRQIAGAFAEYEKARLVSKLKVARERKRKAAGKCEGRKSWAEIRPDLVQEAKRLRRKSPKGGQRSLREIAAELDKLGFKNERGVQFSASLAASILRA